MDHAVETMYEMFSILVFCLAITLLFLFTSSFNETISETKDNIYNQHAISEP